MRAKSTTQSSSGIARIEDVWDRRDQVIAEAFERDEPSIVEALPGTGKSYGSIKWAAETENPLTVLVPRHKLLDDEYEPWCDKHGLTHTRLVSFYRDCPCFDGDGEPIDESARELQADYERGLRGVEVHEKHKNSPCQADGECPYIAGRSFKPSDYDVLLGTYRHAHVEEWIEGRYVVFDEFPGDGFLTTFDGDIAKVITAYLEDQDSLPFNTYYDIIERRDEDAVQKRIEGWKDGLFSLYDSVHVRRSLSPSAHAHGPLATLAVIEMEALENDWRVTDFGQGRVAVLNPKEDEWTFLLPPDLSSAESVVGLDGTPNAVLWELALNEPVQLLPLFNIEEKCLYLRDIVNMRFIQTTDRWKSIYGWRGAAPPKDLALIEGIVRREQQTPALISSQKALRQYKAKGLNTIIKKVEHYGNLKGMNRFEGERKGIILGAPHPGDDLIQMWCAFAGESVEVKIEDGEELRGKETDFGSFGNEVMKTFIHDEVFQAAMRFGRKEIDGERGAKVYLHTSAYPEWLPVKKLIPVIQSWLTKEEGMKKTIEAIRTLDDWQDRVWKTTELYEHTSGLTDRHVRDCCNALAEQGYIEYMGKWGQGTPLHYTNVCLEDAGMFGHVEFPE